MKISYELHKLKISFTLVFVVLAELVYQIVVGHFRGVSTYLLLNSQVDEQLSVPASCLRSPDLPLLNYVDVPRFLAMTNIPSSGLAWSPHLGLASPARHSNV